jgi:hypothetical protein
MTISIITHDCYFSWWESKIKSWVIHIDLFSTFGYGLGVLGLPQQLPLLLQDIHLLLVKHLLVLLSKQMLPHGSILLWRTCLR